MNFMSDWNVVMFLGSPAIKVIISSELFKSSFLGFILQAHIKRCQCHTAFLFFKNLIFVCFNDLITTMFRILWT